MQDEGHGARTAGKGSEKIIACRRNRSRGPDHGQDTMSLQYSTPQDTQLPSFSVPGTHISISPICEGAPACVATESSRCCCIKHFKLSVKIKRCIAKLTNVASKRAKGPPAILVALVYKAVNRMCVWHRKQHIKVYYINSNVECSAVLFFYGH